MNDDRPHQVTRSTTTNRWRRWAGLAAVGIMTTGLVLGVAAPSQAAVKHKAATAVTLRSVHANTGSVVIAATDTVFSGTASTNLIGKKLTVQEGTGGTWSTIVGSGTVSSKKTFSIHGHPFGAGAWTFRVIYAGSSTLKSSASGGKKATVWAWEPLTQMAYVETIGSASSNASPAVRTNVVVGGVNYGKVIGGHEQGSQTGASEFTLNGGCLAITSKIGLADGAPAGTTGTFTLIADKRQVAQQIVGAGALGTISAGIAGVTVLAVENSDVVPATSPGASVTTAWPGAKLLCDVKLSR